MYCHQLYMYMCEEMVLSFSSKYICDMRVLGFDLTHNKLDVVILGYLDALVYASDRVVVGSGHLQEVRENSQNLLHVPCRCFSFCIQFESKG